MANPLKPVQPTARLPTNVQQHLGNELQVAFPPTPLDLTEPGGLPFRLLVADEVLPKTSLTKTKGQTQVQVSALGQSKMLGPENLPEGLQGLITVAIDCATATLTPRTVARIGRVVEEHTARALYEVHQLMDSSAARSKQAEFCAWLLNVLQSGQAPHGRVYLKNARITACRLVRVELVATNLALADVQALFTRQLSPAALARYENELMAARQRMPEG